MESSGAQAVLESTPESQRTPAVPQRHRWSELGLVVLIAIVPLIGSALGSLLYPRAGSSLPRPWRTTTALLHEISSLLLVFYFLARRGEGLKSLGLKLDRWTDLLKALGLALAGLILSAVLYAIVRSTTPAITGHAADVRDPKIIFAGMTLSWAVIYSTSSAVFEEIVVRGFVTSEMIALTCPVWLATLVSIALQTSYHVYYGVAGALGISGIFIVFGIYFARSRRLLPVILGHLFFDLWALWANFHHIH
jgi:hypothetical protein